MGDCSIDNHLRSDPASDVIQDIITGGRRLKILCQTLELGLFDEMETFRHPVSASAIANKCHFNGDVTERLLNNLVCLKLIDKSQCTDGVDVYKNAACTSKYLTRSKRPSLIPNCMSEAAIVLPALDNISNVLKKGTSDVPAQQLMKGERNNNGCRSDNGNNTGPGMTNTNLDRLMMFMSAMDGLVAPCGPAITRAFDLSGHRTAADLGGGSGCLAYEMSRVYPDMRLVVFDLPVVVKTARKLQPEDTRNMVELVPGDFFKDNLPPADLYILSHVVHELDMEKVDLLLSKVFQSLPPGGSLLLLEKLLHEEKAGPALSVSMDLVMAVISKGRERTPTEYQKLLKNHGFANTQVRKILGHNYFDAILAKKPF